MMVLGVICLTIFSILAAYDGIYIHLLRDQLPSFACSRHEHLIHTIRGFLLPPTLVLIFFVSMHIPGIFYAAIGLIALDFFFEFYDLMVEKNSRKPLGGLSWNEYSVHMALMGLRVAFLIFAIRGNLQNEELNSFQSIVVAIVVIGAAVMALLYAFLMKRPQILNRWVSS